MKTRLIAFLFILALAGTIFAARDARHAAGKPAIHLRLNSAVGLEPMNGGLKVVAYRGRQALQLVPLAGHEQSDDSMLAVVTGSDFQDGTIELEVAGAPRKDAAPNMRGFIGLAFRMQGQGSKTEMFYLRPSNARSDDQLQRNHSVQYVSDPDYGWKRLRAESPGVYESYADMEPGAWTKMKIVVQGARAKLYVNGAAEPCLVVNDLKLGESRGQIALWAHSTTEAYFSSLTVSPVP